MTAAASSRPLYGAMMIVGAMIFIGVIDNFVQVFARHAGLWQFHFMRSLIAVPIIIAMMRIAGVSLWPRNPKGALIRTALIAGSMLLYFGSLPMMPIAQVGAGLFSSPIWVLVFSVIIFRAPIGPRRVAAVAVGFAGAMLILRPWEAGFTLWTLVPVASGALYGLAMLATRRYCAEESTLGLNLLFFAALGLAGAAGLSALSAAPQPALAQEAAFFFTGWEWPLPAEAWALLLVQAFGSIICVFMLTRGYQSADTSFVIIFDYTFLLSATITAWVVWGEQLVGLTLMGMVCIVAAGVFIGVRSAALEDG
ncbi:MAG: DMT family transporter [Pseudomonadota bacterium]